LATVVAAWPGLPEAIRAGILAMVNTDFRGRENNQALGGQAALFPGICSSRFPDR
jgi:hypothetical protein